MTAIVNRINDSSDAIWESFRLKRALFIAMLQVMLVLFAAGEYSYTMRMYDGQYERGQAPHCDIDKGATKMFDPNAPRDYRLGVPFHTRHRKDS